MSGAFSGTTLGTPLRRAGVASLTIDGEVFDITATTYDATAATREELDGQNAPHGFSEKPKYGRIGGTIRDAATLTVAAIFAKQNSTLVLALASGKQVYGDQMACLECSAVNTMEASFEVMFIGTVTEGTL